MVILLRTLTETITIKNLKLTSNMVYVKEKQFINLDIIYTVEKVLKSAIYWVYFRKQWPKLLPYRLQENDQFAPISNYWLNVLLGYGKWKRLLLSTQTAFIYSEFWDIILRNSLRLIGIGNFIINTCLNLIELNQIFLLILQFL